MCMLSIYLTLLFWCRDRLFKQPILYHLEDCIHVYCCFICTCLLFSCSPLGLVFTFYSSNSSPVNPFNNGDLVSYTEGDNYSSTSRQNSSSSSASLPPDSKQHVVYNTVNSTSRVQTLTKYSGRKNGNITWYLIHNTPVTPSRCRDVICPPILYQLSAQSCTVDDELVFIYCRQLRLLTSARNAVSSSHIDIVRYVMRSILLGLYFLVLIHVAWLLNGF